MLVKWFILHFLLLQNFAFRSVVKVNMELMFSFEVCINYQVTNNVFEMQSKSGEYQKPFRFSQDHELFDRLSSLLVAGALMHVNS